MAERRRFNMTLSPDQKDRWEEHVEESPDVESLSQLVRMAVSREVNDRESPGDSSASGEVVEKLDEILNQHRTLVSRMDAMEARIGSIEQAVQQDPEIVKLANDVFAVLPTESQLRDYLSEGEGPFLSMRDEHGNIDLAYSGSIDHIANVLDEEELKVQRALDKLQEDTARVHTLNPHEELAVYPEEDETEFSPDEVRYYKEV